MSEVWEGPGDGWYPGEDEAVNLMTPGAALQALWDAIPEDKRGEAEDAAHSVLFDVLYPQPNYKYDKPGNPLGTDMSVLGDAGSV